MDPARLPEHVRDSLAVIGFRVCPPGLRDCLACWDDLDDQDVVAAENDLRLMASALAG